MWQTSMSLSGIGLNRTDDIAGMNDNNTTLSIPKMNPFLSDYNTLHDTIPFSRIKLEDYEPAIVEGIRQGEDEVRRIVESEEQPTFRNTILALEESGEILSKVTSVFFNLLSTVTTDEMDELANKLSPMLTAHYNNISLNDRLFARIKYVYEHELDSLEGEDKELLKHYYTDFVRGGANLDGEKKEKYRALTERLSTLSLAFSKNKLDEINAYELVVSEQKEIEGLPESALEAAASLAKEHGKDGAWMFSLQATSYVPFMTYCANRRLRKEMYMAYNTICTHPNKSNNFAVVREIVDIKRQVAQLLGYDTYADYKLERRMASNRETVYKFIDELTDAYKPTAMKEVEAVREYAKADLGEGEELMPWDFSFYSNKLKEKLYNINSEAVRPYFKLENVKSGIFGLANKLYGIEFRKNINIEVYHPDVEAYEVYDEEGRFLAVFYCDFFPRKSKKSGAWMTTFQEQWVDQTGINHRPLVSIVTNITKPTADTPSLLTLDEVETFLHEFGHALHGMFANTKYVSLSGTNVFWDFVELPSQFMENYSVETDFLKTFARHYQTGEMIPDELVDAIKKSRNFNVAYACLRQLSFCLLDMAYYTQRAPFYASIPMFEKDAWAKVQLLPAVKDTCMSVQFSHIMAGGYSAGYYSYKWAEVLDADAFSKFKETGVFNRETAQSFRENVLSKGSTEHPMTLYKRFRGQEPSIKALLERNGIDTTKEK